MSTAGKDPAGPLEELGSSGTAGRRAGCLLLGLLLFPVVDLGLTPAQRGFITPGP